MYLEVNINRYNPLSASSYIKLPAQLAYKKAVLNIFSTDNKCFAHAVNAGIFPAHGDPSKTSSYPHYTTALNFEGIDFPVKLDAIAKFEEMNAVSVNVFGIDNVFKDQKMVTEIVGPLYFTKARKNTHVNLLLLTDNYGKNHYCLITDLSRLVSSQKSKHHGRLYICEGCLIFFRNPKHLSQHLKNDCNYVRTILPTTDHILNKYGEKLPQNILKFTNFEKQLKVPFCIYADFESLLKPVHHNEPKNNQSFTVKTYEHDPYSFAYYIKCSFDDSNSKLVTYRGLDAPEKFIEMLERDVQSLYDQHLKHVAPMTPLTPEEIEKLKKSEVCHICDKKFKPGDVKVFDHTHLGKGEVNGLAHSKCNLQYKVPKFVPIFFHNLTNYDCHLFIKKLALNKEKITVLAQNKEKYISFSKHILVEQGDKNKDSVFLKLRFLDSFRFLPASIDKLSQTLEPNQCTEIKKYFNESTKFNEIRRKGVFPYTYVDSIDKLDEQILPTKDEFFDILKGCNISDEDYLRAHNIWKLFKCKNLGDYSDIYLKSDVLLLADIFENFRTICLNTYKLDPAQYFTAPSLSFDAMLRYTDVELELLTDVDMLNLFKQNIRGGTCTCSNRKAEANNRFIPDFDVSKRTSYIIYLDATNLYGHSMTQMLPKSEFRWLNDDEIKNFDCKLVDDNSNKGYVLEVDLQYPSEFHDLHNDLPFCPENMKPPNGKFKKLIPNLNDKNKYVIHYRNLKQCLKNGLILRKTHRILEFTQSAWLKTYIDLNTNLRNSAKNEFERDFFKYLINSIFGKTLENVEKRVDIKLLSHWENCRGAIGAGTLISYPNFKSCSVFGENLVAIQMEHLKVTYDKPIYVGFTILDLSKSVIYGFLYDFIKKKYGENATLLYTDTDSLILHIFTENIYDDIKNNLVWFDTSNYPDNNMHKIKKTPSIIGRMKDEFSGSPILSFYGTGAKAYCVKLADTETKKAKGISKSVIQNQLTVNDYKQVVEGGGKIYKKMYTFRSHLHTIYTELQNKVALSFHDDKRFLVFGKTKTLAWGHKSIDMSEQNLDTLLELCKDMFEEDEITNESSSDYYIKIFDENLLD